MKKFFQSFINRFRIGVAILLGIPFLLGGVFAANDCMTGEDLMRCIFNPAVEKDTIIDMGSSPDTVSDNVFATDNTIVIDGDPSTKVVQPNQSVIVKITKFLLSIVVAISVTMILWNGIKYIIETGNGKESKDLIKNLIFIIVGILLALFSVTIIRLMQSVGTTFTELGKTDTNQVFQK